MSAVSFWENIMDRIIFHSDINCCYANIELLHRPKLRGTPVAVAGSVENRHGIILAKDELAKGYGVKTGMAIWQAKQVCPGLVTLEPNYELYLRFAGYVRDIYCDYTNMLEGFGIDESWLDLTGCIAPEDADATAHEIRRRVKAELGITVSIGVSWNKIFAKLGSDYKKPNAVTSITRENFRQLVWPLPAGELLGVGKATIKRLEGMGINTIGEIARANPEVLRLRLGKMGYVIHSFANGRDSSPVRRDDLAPPVKSIGNSTTTPRDIENENEAEIVMLSLAESVGARLREAGFKCMVISVSVRSTNLSFRSHQQRLTSPTDCTRELLHRAIALLSDLNCFPGSLRGLGLCASELVSADIPAQKDLFGEYDERERLRKMDLCIDDIRRRFGFDSIKRGLAASGGGIGTLNAKEDNIIHPVGFFGG